jgi:sporulation protein YlmC with PRC-barrel domain
MEAMHSDRLKGIAVVSMAEGSCLGRVEESRFDPATLLLAGLRAKGDSGELWIPRRRVASVGEDAVTFESGAATQVSAGRATAPLGWDDLQQHKVVDRAGTLLGTVSNLEFDATTGETVILRGHEDGILGLGGETTEIQAERIRSVGSELTTVGE